MDRNTGNVLHVKTRHDHHTGVWTDLMYAQLHFDYGSLAQKTKIYI